MNGLKVMIVDDERATRNGLKNNVDWSRWTIDDVTEACDGEEALGLCNDFKPDIVITDIRMPIMDGVTLATSIVNQYPDTKIIFLSGYSDKDYLKAAIHLGVVNYVEKPIDLEEMEAAIQKAVDLRLATKQMSQMKRQMGDAQKLAVEALLRQNGLTPEDSALIEQTEPGFLSCRYYMVMITKIPSGNGREEADKTLSILKGLWSEALTKVHRLLVVKDDQHIVTVIGYDQQGKRKALADFVEDKFRNRTLEKAMYFSISETVHDIDQIYQAYQSSVIALQGLFADGYGKVSLYDGNMVTPYEVIDTEAVLHQFKLACNGLERKKVLEYLRLFYNSLRMNGPYMSNDVKNISLSLCLTLLDEAQRQISFKKEEGRREDGSFLWEKIFRTETFENLRAYVNDTMTGILSEIEHCNRYSKTVRTIIDTIQNEYMSEDLSTKTLAKKVYLTTAYLSTLFKKETGTTISKYIQQTRLEKSKELLMDQGKQLADVAESVGYAAANYYTKAFKKQYGMTPSEYREKVW